MAFKPANLVRWSPVYPPSPSALPLPIAPPPGLPQQWAYQAGTDAAATVEANGYFYYFADWTQVSNYNQGNFLQVGDVIYCVCSDGNVTLSVTQIGSIIETEVQDFVIPPGSITANDLAANSVTTAAILNANITLAKLAVGITPSHVVKFAGRYTTLGGAAAEAINIPGVLTTDFPFIQSANRGPNTVSVFIAVPTANTLTVTFSADPGAGAIVNYQILRVAS